MNYLSDRYTGPSESWHTSENKLLIPHRSALFKPQARTTGRGCPWVPSTLVPTRNVFRKISQASRERWQPSLNHSYPLWVSQTT